MRRHEFYRGDSGEYYWLGPEVMQRYWPETGWSTLNSDEYGYWYDEWRDGEVRGIAELPEDVPPPPMKGIEPPLIVVDFDGERYEWRAHLGRLWTDSAWTVDGAETTVKDWLDAQEDGGLARLHDVQISAWMRLLEAGCEYDAIERFGSTLSRHIRASRRRQAEWVAKAGAGDKDRAPVRASVFDAATHALEDAHAYPLLSPEYRAALQSSYQLFREAESSDRSQQRREAAAHAADALSVTLALDWDDVAVIEVRYPDGSTETLRLDAEPRPIEKLRVAVEFRVVEMKDDT